MFEIPRESPLAKFIASEIWAKIFGLAVIALIALLFIQPILLKNAEKQKERVIILSTTGEMIYSQSTDWADASELFIEIGKLSTKAVTMRNPKGFDDQKLIERLFGAGALEKLKKTFEQSHRDFKEKNIHQKGLISEGSILEMGKMDIEEKDQKRNTNFVNLLLKGQLIRNGFADGLPFKQVLDFTLNLTLVRNDDLMKTPFLPLKVADFEYTETPQ